MNFKTVSAVAILSVALLTGCSSAPAEKPVEAAPTASAAPSVTSTPTATPKAVENPAPVKRSAEDQEVFDTINTLKDCEMAAFYHNTFEAYATDASKTPAAQKQASGYVDMVTQKEKELGCFG